MTHFSMNIPCSMLCKEMLFKIALGRFWRAWLSQSPGKHGKLCIGPKGPNELSVPPFLNQSPAGPRLPGYSNASQKPLGSGNRSLNRQWDVKTRTPYLFWKSSWDWWHKTLERPLQVHCYRTMMKGRHSSHFDHSAEDHGSLGKSQGITSKNVKEATWSWDHPLARQESCLFS